MFVVEHKLRTKNTWLSGEFHLTRTTYLAFIMLNFRLLAACIGIVIGSILYLFYWNRFIAFLLGLIFRVSFGNQKASGVWLEIGKFMQ